MQVLRRWMIVPNLDLFAWWAISICGGSIFLTLVSIYLYLSTRTKRKQTERARSKPASLVKDFIFVWVLLSLLVFYIVSIQLGSAAIFVFAAGNIIVEVLLILYLIKNRLKESEQT
jgi:H+/Cl- antiporter ClcA